MFPVTNIFLEGIFSETRFNFASFVGANDILQSYLQVTYSTLLEMVRINHLFLTPHMSNWNFEMEDAKDAAIVVVVSP